MTYNMFSRMLNLTQLINQQNLKVQFLHLWFLQHAAMLALQALY